MSNFTVRVELHGANESHYELLHAYMAAAGFFKFVSGATPCGESGTWKLPTAEYDYSSERSAADVRDAVKLLADSVKPGAWVLITEVASRAWSTEKITTR